MLFLSIHPLFVDKIFAGEKTIELRRRRPRSVAGDWIAIYATTPERKLRGIARVTEVRVGGVREMWPEARLQAAVTQKEYESYFTDCERAVGIVLADPVSFAEPVSLERLRELWPNFQPPQGFRYLDDEQVKVIQSFSPRRKKAAA
jgi:predicted transcriptional regulator